MHHKEQHRQPQHKQDHHAQPVADKAGQAQDEAAAGLGRAAQASIAATGLGDGLRGNCRISWGEGGEWAIKSLRDYGITLAPPLDSRFCDGKAGVLGPVAGQASAQIPNAAPDPSGPPSPLCK